MDGVITDVENAKAAARAFTVWVPVISTLAGAVITGVVAAVLNRQNHKSALERDKVAATELQRYEQLQAEETRQKELYYLGTGLVFLLERFADQCSDVACDTETDKNDWSPGQFPRLSYASIGGDWRALPPQHLYKLRLLPVLNEEANFFIGHTFRYDMPPTSLTSETARYRYARLGIMACMAAWRLRKICGLPAPRKGQLRFTVWEVLRRNHRVLWLSHLEQKRKGGTDI